MLVPFVCVNYGAPDDALRYVQAHAGPATPVVVVDNSAQPSAALAQACAGPYAYYHFANANLGYLNGLGRGAEVALARWPEADFVLMSNTDLEFSAEQVLAELAAQPALRQAGVIGPAILSSLHRRAQNPFLRQRPSLSRMRFWETIAGVWWLGAAYQGLSDLRHAWRSRGRGTPAWPSGREPLLLYAAHGAIFILSRAFLDRIRPVQWPCFLFGEEIWLAERAAALGFPVLMLPSIHVVHCEHVVIGKLPSRCTMAWHHESLSWLRSEFWR